MAILLEPGRPIRGAPPFLFWPRGGRKRRVGFWTWDCGWLMAINSISHLSSLPHYWVVAGLSWWVLPCCCSAVLLTSEQVVAASSAALRRCSFDAPSSRSPASQQQGSTHSVRGTEGEGILEMSELWLPQWHCPSYSGRGGRKRRVDFLLGVVAGLWL